MHKIREIVEITHPENGHTYQFDYSAWKGALELAKTHDAEWSLKLRAIKIIKAFTGLPMKECRVLYEEACRTNEGDEA
jgi:hypothetical protein